MNRRILFQVTAPALLIGLLLLAACLASAWYINHLQANLARFRSESVNSLLAAQELEMDLRQFRYHDLLYLGHPTPERRARAEEDHRNFEQALHQALESARSDQEQALIAEIERGYRAYHDELEQLGDQTRGQPVDLVKIADAHPIRHLVDPCHRLLTLNKERMQETVAKSDRVSQQARIVMLLLGLGGPISGLLCGYGIARGLSRSIYQLSVRVQDMAQRLEQDVASISIAGDGDLKDLDRQLQQVVRRVEEVAERVQRQQREMLRAEQLAAVGQLAASVAHEVRNPLTAVKLLVESALKSHNRKPLTEDDLEVIHGEVARLEQTVQGFLDFARLPKPKRSRVDLRDVVSQAAELVRARTRQQRVEITCRLPNQPVSADVDAGQIHTVLVNLFLNALDAMPHGGELEVALEEMSSGLRLTVADTGTGIPQEMAGRLFTPFASSKETGTGLGLSLSRRILEEHGGRITAANRAEGGACFTITLPGPAHDGPPVSMPATVSATRTSYADPVGH
jgi:signal transduction histidine kinase